jgi:probable biosynthetic protein (TIGR04098 family)
MRLTAPEICLNLPQMDASGLSESWLFKHCGDQHWRHLCDVLGAESHELKNRDGHRLYPVFVAVSARYSQPLSAARENERYRTSSELSHFGRGIFRSEVVFESDDLRCALEMITTFTRRRQAGANDLSASAPAAGWPYRCRALASRPELLAQRLGVAHGDPVYHCAGHAFDLQREDRDRFAVFEPSPYVDYNGLGLLYFAAYPAIVETQARSILKTAGFDTGGQDWVQFASTIARDVHYHRNLAMGVPMRVTINSARRENGHILLHTRASDPDGSPLADVVTVKQYRALS